MMIDGFVKEFMSSSQGSNVLSQLDQEGLSPDKAQEAVQATAEGAMQHGGSAGLDLSGLLSGSEGGFGGIAGALGGMTGGAKGPAASSGALSKLTGPVTEFVAQKGFPRGVAEKVVSVVLPKLLEMVRKH
jgi:hypothetical protein